MPVYTTQKVKFCGTVADINAALKGLASNTEVATGLSSGVAFKVLRNRDTGRLYVEFDEIDENDEEFDNLNKSE